ncbi:hypothetical protein PanWU01x14_369870, partial [Parasponia andersonii]
RQGVWRRLTAAWVSALKCGSVGAGKPRLGRLGARANGERSWWGKSGGLEQWLLVRGNKQSDMLSWV